MKRATGFICLNRGDHQGLGPSEPLYVDGLPWYPAQTRQPSLSEQGVPTRYGWRL